MLASHNSSYHPDPSDQQPLHFTRSGNKPITGIKSHRPSLLKGATDWQLLIDYDRSPILFPPEILPTPLHPDIIIWSTTRSQIIIFELTCGAEEGIPAAVIRKKARYRELVSDITSVSWTCSFRTMEVGARGFVAHSTRRCLASLGKSYSNALRICKKLSLVSARCSYAIWLSRKTTYWDRNRAYITVPIPITFPKHIPTSKRQHALVILSALSADHRTPPPAPPPHATFA